MNASMPSASKRDFDWYVGHALELDERFGGKWIAIRAEQVVGEGDTAVEASDLAGQRCGTTDVLLVYVPRDPETWYGSLWLATD